MASPLPGSSQRKRLYVPPMRTVPVGVAGNLPVLAAQQMLRSNMYEGAEIVATDTHALVRSPSRDVQFTSPSPTNARTPPHHTTLTLPIAISSAAEEGVHSPSKLRMRLASRGHRQPLVAAQVDGSKALQRLSDEIDAFIRQELGILERQNDGSIDEPGPQRLAVYRSSLRLMLPAIPVPLQRHVEAVFNEYDRFIHSLEMVAQDDTRVRERQKLEAHFTQHFTEEAHMKEAELAKKKKEFENTQSTLKGRMATLEKQLVALQNENRSLKAQQNEETERYGAMAQSVIESRLAANKAELALLEMKEIYDKVRMVEANTREIMQDYGKMLKLVRLHKLPFEPKSESMIDALLRDGSL